MIKIPATIITGFLGSGKTTLIRNMMIANPDRRFALIINEFGEKDVDGDLLTSCNNENCNSSYEIRQLANGCLCCTVADDFLPLMESLLDRPDPPEHIIIESSGLALPKPLVKAFHWPAIRTRMTVDAVITLVDGPAVADGLFTADAGVLDQPHSDDEERTHDSPLEELFEDQIRAADMIVLNKSDLVNAEKLEAVRATGSNTDPVFYFKRPKR